MVKFVAKKPTAIALPDGITSVQTVYRRNPSNGRITVCRLKLITIDGVSRPILSNGKDWVCGIVSEQEREQYLVDNGKGLVKIPRGTMK